MSTAKKLDKQYFSYADYLDLKDDQRREIIDGTVYNMSPAPRPIHQELSGKFYRQIANFLKGKDCRVYSAPFDVRFIDTVDKDKFVHNVVQPDLSIICDKNKIDDRGCKGSPDWIIEILSPSTAKNDLQLKFKLYEKFGVKEYWIVDPIDGIVWVYKLNENGKYYNSHRYVKGDKAKTIFEDLIIDLNDVFV